MRINNKQYNGQTKIFYRILSLILVIFCPLILVSCGKTDDNESTLKYTITYISKFGDIELKKEEKTALVESSIEYEAPEILGYKFVGWEDNVETETRTDNTNSNNVIVANYDIELLEAPVVIISTEESKPVDQKETYVDCKISIINTDEEYCLDSVSAGIRGRGNSTWNFPKKPYRIKFDSKQSLFGSSYKQKSWTLLANYSDKSLSRNAIAYEMAENFDNIKFSSIHQFVDVYMNNEYIGLYLLCDQIQTGSGRVDVDENFYADGDTGYLVEMDARAPEEGTLGIDYFGAYGNYYALKTPDTEDEEFNAEIYVNFIKNYIENSLGAISTGSWEDVCEYIDVNSFVDVYIIQELFSNTDVGFSSFYLYKDKGEKLYCGPIWDFDLSAGNNRDHKGVEEWDPTEGLWARTTNAWFARLFIHEEFVDLVKQKLNSYNSKIMKSVNLANVEDSDGYYNLYKQSFERNFKKWDILNSYVWPNTDIILEINTVDGQIDYLFDWLNERYLYLVESI